jgi:hypothetical protein
VKLLPPHSEDGEEGHADPAHAGHAELVLASKNARLLQNPLEF